MKKHPKNVKTSTEFLKTFGTKRSFAEIKSSKIGKQMIALAEKEFAELGNIPELTYSAYREYSKSGERRGYDFPYLLKRKRLALSVIAAYLTGEQKYLDLALDYIVSICEESTWVLPGHEEHSKRLDLYSADTGLELAEAVGLLSSKVPEEIKARVRNEVNKRIFKPYLKHHKEMWWYKGTNNWNGVCNSCVGSTFLHLETDKARLNKALQAVLAGLKVFIDTAFEEDGGSTEGVAYWHYGLSNYLKFAELLRFKTKGKTDLLCGEKIKNMALYPLKMSLAPGLFANFSDCEEKVYLAPGIITRFAERTNSPELKQLLNPPDFIHFLYLELCDLFWQDNKKTKLVSGGVVTDNFLRSTQVVRLTAKRASGKNTVLMVKGGHNGENHNHNDLGSFILHIDGENLLCDPGSGLYNKDYFNPAKRYNNVFCTSYGHSLPVVGGNLQKKGREHSGEITVYDPKNKKVELELAKAYGLPEVESFNRSLTLKGDGAVLLLEDRFSFTKELAVEEAFLTWFPVKCKGDTARIKGKKNELELKIEEPKGAVFSVKKLKKECRENAKTGILNRLSFKVPGSSKTTLVRVKIAVRRSL